MDYFISLLAGAVAVLLIFVPHEFAHAYMAYKNGDATAKMYGRLTLNPVKHLDPIGFALCIFAGFGWAKPVPIDPYNFKNYKRGMFLTAIAGVVTNYIIAFFMFPVAGAVYKFLIVGQSAFLYENELILYIVLLLFYIPYLTYAYGMNVFVFNLLPLNPLDGFRVVEALTRQVNPVQRFLKNYSQYILIGLIIESYLCNMLVRYADLPIAGYFNILGYVGWFARNIIGKPIELFWGLFELTIPALV